MSNVHSRGIGGPNCNRYPKSIPGGRDFLYIWMTATKHKIEPVEKDIIMRHFGFQERSLKDGNHIYIFEACMPFIQRLETYINQLMKLSIPVP